MVISLRAPETAPTPVDGSRDMTDAIATFGVKSPCSIRLQNVPKASMLKGSDAVGADVPQD